MARSSRRRSAVLVASAAVAATVLVPGAAPSTPPASAAAPARIVTGWIPYWEMDDQDGAVGVRSAPAVFADASTFNFSAVGAAQIDLVGGETAFSRTMAALRTAGITTFATITDGTPRLAMAAILADPVTRAQHVQALVALAKGRQVDGIDIDYEGFAFDDGQASWVTTRPAWVAFVRELGAALHAEGKLLAVTVPPIWDGGRRGYPVYDWAAIIDHVDRLRLMVYDWSFTQAGPNAPMSWVDSVIAYTKATIPWAIGKVQLGVPTYGYNYADPKPVAGTCPSNASFTKLSLQTEDAAAFAASKGAVPVRDASGEMTFTYTIDYEGVLNVSLSPPGFAPPEVVTSQVDASDETGLKPAIRVMQPGAPVRCTIRRTVYYPDSESVLQRARAALDAGMAGIAIWALGYESTDLWAKLAALDPATPAATLGTGTLGDVDAALAHPGGVEVRGWAFDPESPLPVTVQVSVDGGPWSGPVLARDQRADVAAAYQVEPDHGFHTVVPTGAAPGARVCVRAEGWGDAAEPTELGCVVAEAPTAPPQSGPQSTASPEPQPTASPEPQPTASPEPQPTASPEPQPPASAEPQPTPSPEPAAAAPGVAGP